MTDANAETYIEDDEVERMIKLQVGHNADDIGEQEQVVPMEDEHLRNNVNHIPHRIPLPHVTPASNSLKTVRFLGLYYTSFSIFVAVLYIIYIIRTCHQVYLAVVYLISSKASCILLGNAVLSLFIKSFYIVTNIFLGGLKPTEKEGIAENMRWNVTETCIALAMFQPEVDVMLVLMFCCLVLGKCLHWAVELRGTHLRMTQDFFHFMSSDMKIHENISSSDTILQEESTLFKIRLTDPFSVKKFLHNMFLSLPRIQRGHIKFIVLVSLLLLCDIYPIFFSVKEFMDKGPGVHILFGFECSLLLVSSMSTFALHWMHIIDGSVTVLQHFSVKSEDNINVLEGKNEHGTQDKVPDNHESVDDTVKSDFLPISGKTSIYNNLSQILIASWLENRATLTFAVELTAHAAKFLFYLLFFFAVYSFYGVPLNIVREIYSSFVKLRQRLLAFSSYHRLTRSMNKHFSTITTEEELDTAGRTCIICRDRMEVTGTNGGCKELPACQHVFHKHCLRQWLVQQQTCPTCRREILSRKSDSRKSTNQEQVEMNDVETLTPIQNEDEKGENNSSKLTSEILSGHLREKISSRVIISTGIKETKSSLIVPENINQDKHRDMFNLQFPCIFRVIAQDGANVISVNELNNTSKTQWKKIRTIPLGKLVVVTELRCVPKRSETISGGKEQVVILHKIPDGWVFGTDLHIVLMLGVN